MRRIPWITVVMALLAGLVHASPALTAALEFDRAMLTRGEFWRLLTGHLAHFGADHLVWNVAALAILGTMSESRDRPRFLATLLGAAAAIGLAVWLLQPHFAVYRGLSGIDSALFGLVCARLILDGRRVGHAFSVWLGALALSGFALKCGLELASGATVFAAGGGVRYAPVPLAHLVGLVIGTLGALPPTPSHASPPPPPDPSPSPA